VHIRRRHRLVACLVGFASLVMAAGVTLPAARADVVKPNGGLITKVCRAQQGAHPKIGPPTCRSLQNGEWQAASECRLPLYEAPDPSTPETCAVLDGRPISDAAINRYQSTWVHQALTLQRGLDEHAPLVQELLPHTHNSFNASQYRIPADGSLPRYYPTLTNQDSNQVYDITGQLDMDIRAIEIDLHWVPSPFGSAATNGFWVTLCHGNSQSAPVPGAPIVHVGCSADRPMEAGLDEVAAWLRSHPDEIVLLYLENQMSGSVQAHQVAGDLLQQHLGDLIEPTPSHQPCAPMPMDDSRADIKAHGHRVLIVGNCDAGATTSWGASVHERGPRWDEHGDSSHYDEVACNADRAARRDGATFRRYFEDSTWVAAMAGSNKATSSLGGTSAISVDATAAMVRCGANIIGFDQLTPDDPRLAALVWSWAPGQPQGSGACAEQRGDARFQSRDCSTSLPYACLDAAGAWHQTQATGPWSGGVAACAAEVPGARYAVPVNGYGNSLLAGAKRTDASDVWLNYALAGATWTPNSAAPTAPAVGLASASVATAQRPSGTQPSADDHRAMVLAADDRSGIAGWGLLIALALGGWVLAGGLWIRRRRISSRAR
jgi:hypothetical protein